MPRRVKPSPLLSEIERLRAENERLNETIKNVSFNENPDIFCVRKDSDYFFPNVTVLEAATLIKTVRSDLKVNIAWEVIKEE